MILTSAFVSFYSCLDACLDAVGVRPPVKIAVNYGGMVTRLWIDEAATFWSGESIRSRAAQTASFYNKSFSLQFGLSFAFRYPNLIKSEFAETNNVTAMKEE
jgi:hypothetical protein